MVQMKIEYEGGLHCSALHEPSGNVISTDAPVDNHGRGEAFSPTDLMSASLGACMCTVMGIVAKRKGIAMEGASVTVRKHMSEDTPRRIARIELDIVMPLPADHPERAVLEAAGKGCPVHHSLHPDIEVAIDWKWAG